MRQYYLALKLRQRLACQWHPLELAALGASRSDCFVARCSPYAAVSQHCIRDA
jgi:hypothetical protein